MTSLTFYGGINEIGGNKILLEDRGTRIFLDFGLSLTAGEEYFTGYLQPRSINLAGDYLEFRLLPRIEGLYGETQIAYTDLKYIDPEFDAIILSHAHVDHSANICFIDETIPICLGETTKTFLEVMEETGTQKFGEHPYETFRTGDTLKIGSMEIEPIHVDHSIPAAYGFIIHTSKGAIVYTGDLRLHGTKPEMTEEFIEKAKETRPIAMISEGTRFGPVDKRTNHSEAQVRKESIKVALGTKKLLIASFYGRDIDRINTFHKVAKATGRRFVISARTAYLLDKLKGDLKLKVPKIGDDVIVYQRRKGSYYNYEKMFSDKDVDFEYVRKNQSQILMSLDLVNFTELIDIRPHAGGNFIHSMSEPYSEDDIEEEVMRNWLNHFGLHFHQIHASGHASAKEIAEIIGNIKPKCVFPVHTEHPELFKKTVGEEFKIVAPESEIKYGL